MSLLEVSALTREFGGVRAVDDLSFAIDAGRVHSLIGPNGAGKTTLLNLLTGIYRPSAGTIRLDGRDISGLTPSARARLGMARTFQNLQVFFNMTALENVMAGRHLHDRCNLAASLLRLPALRATEATCRREAEALLDYVGLGAYRGVAADALPYGALKRLEIARALATRPRLLLLDEPAAGLNATETAAIDALIRRVAGEGVTVILVEHNMRLVMEVSEHILVLDYGRLLAEGDAHSVRNDPRVIEAYLGGGAANAASQMNTAQDAASSRPTAPLA
jgi:branched-chain amino acid transport system ATP-binding protein